MVRVSSSVFFLLTPLLLSIVGCDGARRLSDLPHSGDGGAGGESAESTGDRPVELPECPASTQGFATEVVSFEFGEGQNHGQGDLDEAILGGPEGGGCCSGSLQVASLGDGGHVVLGFGDRTIVDGEGPDFIVFENAFSVSGEDDEVFFELGRVSVSQDGERWFDFPCNDEKAPYEGCAGRTPVLANFVQGVADPFDVDEAGGDAFDLSDLDDLNVDSIHFVRITDIEGDQSVFDLDAVSIVHGLCQ